LERLSGAVNLAEWVSYFTFDFMGDMAFGGGFEMLRDGGDKQGLWTMVEEASRTMSMLSNIPWFAPILYKMPMATRWLKGLQKFGAACAAKRVQTGSQVKDLWYHLMDETGMEKQKPSMAEVVADGALSIVAGSDTTATAISCCVWFILSNREIYSRVQTEVDSVYPDGESLLDTSRHPELRFLTACLNETLRLCPPVPTNGPRQVSSGGGKLIAGCFIPKHTQIFIPPYSLHRSAENFFPSPEKFDPDRWLRRPNSDEVLNVAAFIPFSYGAANCVGKPLAWREMLMVTSTLVKKFNLRFADGFQSDTWLNSHQDIFVTSMKAPLLVEISPR